MRKIKVECLETNLFKLNMVDCFEFLLKYFNTAGWQAEMEEIHGCLQPAAYIEILKELDLTIVHQETYLLPLLKKKWKSDFVLEGGVFPDSTMILVAEKNSAYAGGR